MHVRRLQESVSLLAHKALRLAVNTCACDRPDAGLEASARSSSTFVINPPAGGRRRAHCRCCLGHYGRWSKK